MWQGAIALTGYGQIQDAGRKLYAHRVSYETAVGPIPDDKVIDHLCRNRACINPSHLEPVPQRLNVRRGDKPILTFDQAVYIAKMRGQRTAKSLGEELGVHKDTVRNIWRGRTWTDAAAAAASWAADRHDESEAADD